jgi:hypothetical protein
LISKIGIRELAHRGIAAIYKSHRILNDDEQGGFPEET